MLVVAVIAPGAMGSGVAKRLTDSGAEVWTVLDGRSDASRQRAEEAGMKAVGMAQLAQADIVLSIVPPGDAVGLAESLAPVLRNAKPGLIYVDCNAISPQTALVVQRVIEPTGVGFVDAGIFGRPPVPNKPGPMIYVCGAVSAHVSAVESALREHGLEMTALDGPVGSASGLKMSYAGITKGLTSLGSAMMLAATRFGADKPLLDELARSQPELLGWLNSSVPAMYSKAYRWVAEMQEISAFAGDDAAAADIYRGIAAFYQQMAADHDGEGRNVATLKAFMKKADAKLVLK